MCRPAYEKCACFVFLVILTVLNCSGYRIDNLAMTDISKKNFLPEMQTERLFFTEKPHRIRHQRLRRAQLRTPEISPLIEQPSNHQITSTSTKKTKRNKKRKQQHQLQQNDDISVKAYRSEVVLLARNIASNSSNDNQWLFKRGKVYKDVGNQSMDTFVLEIDLKDKELYMDYLLFLNFTKAGFRPAAPPKLIRRKFNEASIIRVCQPNFVPKPPKVVDLRAEIHRSQSDKRILRCSVRGFPIPKIVWKRNGKVLRQNRLFRIQYKRKESRLTIRKVSGESVGEYECVAEGVDGRTASKNVTITTKNPSLTKLFSAKECDDNKKKFCYNGGTCQVESTMGELYCICPPDYSGIQCDKKDPTDTSMYPQPAIYTCKVGLSTKIYC